VNGSVKNMCGIIGAYANLNLDLLLENTSEGVKKIKHRGPDAEGIYSYQSKDKNLCLGHTRLSIIDLDSRSNQPMISNNGRYIIVYNGEIYNYIYLRKELENDGYKFITNSDTEVILAGYMFWGHQLYNRLDGIFAFAIYDKNEEELITVRDQLGVKPLYYYVDKETNFSFSSEIKALLKYKFVTTEFDSKVLPEFLLNTWLYEPETGLKNIKKLEPGSYMVVNNDKIETIKYWDVTHSKINSKKAKNNIEADLKRNIENQLISDVDLGILYSGGVDSSLIGVNIEQKVVGFIAKYPEDEIKKSGFTNDFMYAEKILKYTNMDLKVINMAIDSKEELIENINFIAENTEELIADYTFIPTYEICKEASNLGYKVLLSGMGADELFVGYTRYRAIKFSATLKTFRILDYILRPFKFSSGKIGRIKKNIRRLAAFSGDDLALSYGGMIGFFTPDEITKLITNNNNVDVFSDYKGKFRKIYDTAPKRYSTLKKILYTDMYGCLTHNLIVADKASMKASVELRVPLIAKDLAEKIFNIDDRHNISFFDQKRLLKRILSKKVPKNLVYRSKAGFNPPTIGLISKLTESELNDLLLNNKYIKKYMNVNFIRDIIKRHTKKMEDNSNKLWTLLFFATWIDNIEKLLRDR
jgi:asparagine synthase (glutamine-hydrolysing)